MNSLNHVTISGNLGKDPEIKEFNSGNKKAILNIAISESVKVNDQWEQKTTWMQVEFWNNQADFIAKYLKKGSFIVIEGKLAVDQWEREGQPVYRTYIKGNHFVAPNQKSNNDSSTPNEKHLKVVKNEEYETEDIPF